MIDGKRAGKEAVMNLDIIIFSYNGISWTIFNGQFDFFDLIKNANSQNLKKPSSHLLVVEILSCKGLGFVLKQRLEQIYSR